jgi:hypothetical protein
MYCYDIYDQVDAQPYRRKLSIASPIRSLLRWVATSLAGNGVRPIHALVRTQLLLLMGLGCGEGCIDDDRRRGTTTPLTALNVATAEVITQVQTLPPASGVPEGPQASLLGEANVVCCSLGLITMAVVANLRHGAVFQAAVVLAESCPGLLLRHGLLVAVGVGMFGDLGQNGIVTPPLALVFVGPGQKFGCGWPRWLVHVCHGCLPGWVAPFSL